MKHKEKLFELLRACAETPQESFAVEEMIRKVNGEMLPIETISDTQKKFAGLKFYKNKGGNFCCTMSIHRFIWNFYNGEIPDGCDIHHRDFNHDNNDIANLELVTKDEHKKIHTAIKSKRKPEKNQNSSARSAGANMKPSIAATTITVRRSAKKLPNVPAPLKLKRAKSAASSFRRETTQDFVRANASANRSSGKKRKLVPSAAKLFRTL